MALALTEHTAQDPRDRRCEQLAVAPAERLVELAARVLAEPSILSALTIIQQPETGTVVMQVREPVRAERFHLGEVVVTRAEVALDGHRGWAIRLGTDRLATLAAALCGAIAESSRPEWTTLAAEVQTLCVETSEQLRSDDEAEWAEISRTAVAFEALDQ